MPQLFEKYVAKTLQKQLKPGHRLQIQPSRQTLVSHTLKSETQKTSDHLKQQNWFGLEPDLAIYKGTECQVVLDTKWKFINQEKANSKDKYGISQADLYQMFAYGQKYLEGRGKIVLIYPMHQKLNEHLPVFDFSDELTLYVIPFDLKEGKLIEQSLIEELI